MLAGKHAPAQPACAAAGATAGGHANGPLVELALAARGGRTRIPPTHREVTAALDLVGVPPHKNHIRKDLLSFSFFYQVSFV
jgi:hypothetical protein